jgi:hypothetical protein
MGASVQPPPEDFTPMRRLIATAVLTAGLAVAGLAVAAPSAATKPAAMTTTTKATTSRTTSKTAAPAQTSKMASCNKAWKAQSHHTGTYQAYIKSCLAKG